MDSLNNKVNNQDFTVDQSSLTPPLPPQQNVAPKEPAVQEVGELPMDPLPTPNFFQRHKQLIIYVILAVIIVGLAAAFARYFQLYKHDHAIVTSKTNCDVCPESEACPECPACETTPAATAPAASTTKKSTTSTSSAQESVLTPPAPPSD